MPEVTSHTVIAMTTLAGGFAMLLVSIATGRPLTDGDQVLVTMLMSSVVGFYFGSRSALSGVAAGSSLPTPAPTVEQADAHQSGAGPRPGA